jgi:hypothetical protein
MDVSAHIAASWARVMARMGRGNFTDRMGVDRKVIARTLSGETVPELHTALGSLLVDPTSLDEVLALYGFGLHRLPDGGKMDTTPEELGDVLDFAASFSAYQRGPHNHQSKLKLAESARPVAQVTCGIVAEADRLRGLAASSLTCSPSASVIGFVLIFSPLARSSSAKASRPAVWSVQGIGRRSGEDIPLRPSQHSGEHRA